MSDPWTTTLFAISYDVIPELREQRERYYEFWNRIGGAAILGWLVALVLFRVRPRRAPWPSVVAVAALSGGTAAGWFIWSALSNYSWGDIGVGSRWFGELAACILGAAGWLLVAGWAVAPRAKPDSSMRLSEPGPASAPGRPGP